MRPLLWQRQMLVLRTPLHSNSVYLVGNSAVVGFLGFMFWVVAARLYTAEDVGLGSALISAALLLSFLARFGLGFGVIRFLPANQVIQEQIQHLLERPTEWPSREPIISYHDFAYQTQSWHLPRRVVAKVEWHQGELFPRVGFIVTNLS